jgi:hypothetical protein
MSFDLSVTLKSGIAAKDRRERKETNRRCTQIYADLSWASIRAFVLKAILPLATWPDLAAVYLNLRRSFEFAYIRVYPRLSLYSCPFAVRFFCVLCVLLRLLLDLWIPDERECTDRIHR